MCSIAKNCRYNVNGFVEELPKLPEKRSEHTCAVLPATGVRPTQSGSPTPLLVSSQEGRGIWLVGRQTQLTFKHRHLLWPVGFPRCWHCSLVQQHGFALPPSHEPWTMSVHRLWEAGLGWLGEMMEAPREQKYCKSIKNFTQYWVTVLISVK